MDNAVHQPSWVMSHYTTLHKYGERMHQRKIKMELKNVFNYLYFGFILLNNYSTCACWI